VKKKGVETGWGLGNDFCGGEREGVVEKDKEKERGTVEVMSILHFIKGGGEVRMKRTKGL